MSAIPNRTTATSSYDPETIECPWHYDASLREKSPVYHDEANDMYVVSSYELVDEVLNNSALYSSRYMEKMLSKEPFAPEIMAIYAQGFQMREALLVSDGEVHERHRRIALKAFSRKRLDALAPLFQQRITLLLDQVIPKGRMEFRAAVAKPVPVNILQQQLRIPDADMPRALEWSDILDSGFGGIDKSHEQLKHEAEQIVACEHYFAERITLEKKRLQETGQGERDDDLLTLLAQAMLDPENPMEMDEAISYLINLFPATHGTTTALLMACMHRFTAHSEVQQQIGKDPALIGDLIEETLRHETTARAFWRRTLQDVTLGGVAIAKDQWILLRISAANRDPCVFENADEFNINRPASQPHLTFSNGIHFCVGRQFARHIITEVIGQLASRARDFRFAEGKNTFLHKPNMLLAGYEELHLEFTPLQG